MAFITLSPKLRLVYADCRDVLCELPDNFIDSCVTDPPYALRFMGKTWDTGEVTLDPAFWTEMLRVLKPGAHVTAFGASRGYHRMTCAIEDAGFEIRDSLMWIYGSGFPKSQNVALAMDKKAGAIGHLAKSFNMKGGGDRSDEFEQNGRDLSIRHESATDAAREWQGWGTALKPAFEPIVLARKPLSEKTVAANVLKWGTGALNISACRVPTSQDGVRNNRADSMAYTCLWHEVSRMHHNGGSSDLALFAQQRALPGRHSSSVSAHGPEDQLLPDLINDCLTCSHCGGGFPRSATMLDLTRAQPSVGVHILRAPESCPKREHILLDPSMSSGHTAPNVEKEQGRWPANVCHDGSDEVVGMFPANSHNNWRKNKGGGMGYHGGKGDDRLDAGHFDFGSAARFFYSAKANAKDRAGSKHPTVKPIALMQWLARLITPPGGIVIDPFAGSGTTGAAAAREGFTALLCEREEEYVRDIMRRFGVGASA